MNRGRHKQGNCTSSGQQKTQASTNGRNFNGGQHSSQRNLDSFGMGQPVDRPANNQPNQTGRRKQEMRTVTCEEVGINTKNKSLVARGFPEKVNEGRLGKRIKLISNLFPLIIPDGVVYHYDVKVKKSHSTPTESESTSETESSDSEEVVANGLKKMQKNKKYKCLNTKINRQVINAMLETYDIFKGLYPVYDGKRNLYTRYLLEIEKEFKCEIVRRQQDSFDPNDTRGPRMEHFRIVLKPSKRKNTTGCAINLEPLHALFEGRSTSVPEEAIMALETVLRNLPCMRHVPIGRSFFYPPHPDDLHPLGGGREIWFGYHQSMRLGQWQPMVNLDVTATAFYKRRPMLDYIAEEMFTEVEGLHRIGGLEEHSRNKMSQELKNLQIEVTHLKGYRRKYRIQEDLTSDSANRLTFTNGENIQMTVAEYFAQRYEPLRFPHLPCIQIKSKSNENSIVYLPVEVCEIIVQHCNKELTVKQGTEMIKFTAKPPAARFKEIEDVFTKANFKNDVYLKEFEMEVLPQPMKVEARILNAPSVRYDQENKVKPLNGAWNMKGQKYFAKAQVKSWVLLSFAHVPMNMLRHFATCLKSMANKQGIEMRQYKHIQQVFGDMQNVHRVLLEMKQKYGVDLLVIVMPNDKGKKKNTDELNSKTLYNAIKQVAETTTVGLTTQCITADNVVKLFEKDNPSLISNLCLKINTKMGGINHLLTPGETPLILQDKPVIIMGADVNHPGPSADNDPKPSIAAVVGSLNSDASCYAVSIRSQVNKKLNRQVEEIIHDLKDMVIYLLKQFYVHTNRKKPEKIIFYRDGVSEGQFKDVQTREIKKIREACRSLSGEYEPGITYIIVQKRHHVKFKPEDERDGIRPMHNIPPGTVIDTTVTHPLNSDFYLCSQFGLKGTSRPGYYTVAADDNDLTADQLQKLTYFLCYTFARCTRSISLPAPVQYAHLAAYRARLHLISKEKGANNRAPQRFALDVSRAIEIDDNLKNTMYFI